MKRALIKMIRSRAAEQVRTDPSTEGFNDDLERILGHEPTSEEWQEADVYAQKLADTIDGGIK